MSSLIIFHPHGPKAVRPAPRVTNSQTPSDESSPKIVQFPRKQIPQLTLAEICIRARYVAVAEHEMREAMKAHRAKIARLRRELNDAREQVRAELLNGTTIEEEEYPHAAFLQKRFRTIRGRKRARIEVVVC